MKIKRDFKSIDFWIESIINSFGSILIPNNIKYPRQDGDVMDQRYHEPTSFRYLTMQVIFLVENVILITLSNMNFNPSSTLYDIFQNDEEKNFFKLFPLWTLGLFSLALVLQFMYYQTHAWPISPNCFRMKFLCPYDNEKNELEETDENQEGKLVLLCFWSWSYLDIFP